ncbi:hypothetical protein ACFQZ4_32840 [Catellatospora coxensis]
MNGRTAGSGLNLCVGEGRMGFEGFFTTLDPVALDLVTGRPATVTLELTFGRHGDEPLPQGTIAVAVGEPATYAELPWPGAAPSSTPLDRTLHSGVDPATVATLESGARAPPRPPGPGRSRCGRTRRHPAACASSSTASWCPIWTSAHRS